MDILIIGLAIIALSFVALRLLSRKKRFSQTQLKQALNALEKASGLSPSHAILDMHKNFVHNLQILSGKKEKAAQSVQRFAKRFPNEKDVWYFHRMRNRAAHEHSFRATPNEREKAYETYQRALESLGK